MPSYKNGSAYDDLSVGPGYGAIDINWKIIIFFFIIAWLMG